MDLSGERNPGNVTEGVFGLAVAISGSLLIVAASFTPWAVVVVSLA